MCVVSRMVEAELFPALRKFGLRFYAYNPVSSLYSSAAILNKQTSLYVMKNAVRSILHSYIRIMKLPCVVCVCS